MMEEEKKLLKDIEQAALNIGIHLEGRYEIGRYVRINTRSVKELFLL